MKNKIALAFLAMSEKYKKLKQTIQFKIFIQLMFWLMVILVYNLIAKLLTAQDDLLALIGLILGIVLLVIVIGRFIAYMKWMNTWLNANFPLSNQSKENKENKSNEEN